MGRRRRKYQGCLECGSRSTVVGRSLCGPCYGRMWREGTLDILHPMTGLYQYRFLKNGAMVTDGLLTGRVVTTNRAGFMGKCVGVIDNERRCTVQLEHTGNIVDLDINSLSPLSIDPNDPEWTVIL